MDRALSAKAAARAVGYATVVHRALAVLAALGASACYAAHSRTPRVDDASVSPTDTLIALSDAPTPDDAFAPPPDIALPDAAVLVDASSCARPGTERPVRACILEATGRIPAGVPYALPLGYVRCECPATRACTATVSGASIALTTSSCDDPVECDECEFEVACDLPPLAPGYYEVSVDCALAMEVYADWPTMPRVAHPLCAPLPPAPDASLV